MLEGEMVTHEVYLSLAAAWLAPPSINRMCYPRPEALGTYRVRERGCCLAFPYLNV